MAAKSTPPKEPSKGGSGFQSLPLEAQGKKKNELPPRQPKRVTTPKKVAQPKTQPKVKANTPGKSAQAIPDVVSKRMGKRMALFCGIPTLLGLGTFPTSYFIVQKGIELPNVAVLFVSLGLFGLGVVGLTYGVLSASWDEDRVGGWLGFQEFQTNFGRMTEGWKAARERQRS